MKLILPNPQMAERRVVARPISGNIPAAHNSAKVPFPIKTFGRPVDWEPS